MTTRIYFDIICARTNILDTISNSVIPEYQSNCKCLLLAHDRTYEAIVTITGIGRKSWLVYKTEQFVRLCFGGYVNITMGVKCHNLLCHYLMCKEYTTLTPPDLHELLFLVHDYLVCFNRKAFCLIIGLWFRKYFPRVLILHSSEKHAFSFVSLSRLVRMADLMHSVTNELLAIVSNLDEFNRYLWGRVIWDFTYKQLCIVFDKIMGHLNPNEPRVGSRHTYTMLGFVYAFKVVIPLTVAYPRMRRLHGVDCERTLDVRNVCILVHLIIYKFL
ncbi:unnamed protein product [Lactuca saligna]|uniref:Uncharacterized protein n=1 Tax=Lactuca saligna TaxID=75948 RepID=A0AA35ZET6_LACSI|nr:unnamed protein product [Lactuca saligna]